jgi:hypothetical protein
MNPKIFSQMCLGAVTVSRIRELGRPETFLIPGSELYDSQGGADDTGGAPEQSVLTIELKSAQYKVLRVFLEPLLGWPDPCVSRWRFKESTPLCLFIPKIFAGKLPGDPLRKPPNKSPTRCRDRVLRIELTRKAVRPEDVKMRYDGARM